MTVQKKNEFEKEIGEALLPLLNGTAYGVEVQSYSEDGCMANIDVKLSMTINGAISDLPSGYRKGDPESEYIVALVKSEKKMDWKEFDNVRSELRTKGYQLDWNTYYKDEPVTDEVIWKVAPCNFTYEIVKVDSYY